TPLVIQYIILSNKWGAVQILAFLFFLLRFLLCFLMKTAIAIPLKKSGKIKINVFLRGSCFQRGCFCWDGKTAAVACRRKKYS
ncbi:hypothetical protein, partial [Anaerotignum lactatifermentans]|uniref:hypothetical protein n=1 Tax=Anaerotignum lactatifermentans TaxID=160404 RepID=UPI0027BB0480